MRILVSGHRKFDDWALLTQTMDRTIPHDLDTGEQDYGNLVIIEGGAPGADFLARVWAKWMYVKFEEYPADWDKYGKAAGPIRNKQMLDEGKPDLVVAFLAKDSVGTKNMIEQAEKAGIPVKVIEI